MIEAEAKALRHAHSHSLAIEPQAHDEMQANRLHRLQEEFKHIAPWSHKAAQDAYRNLYSPGQTLPSSHAVRVIVDSDQRIYFRPEPYDLFADPNKLSSGVSYLGKPKGFAPIAALATTTYPWSRTLLEVSKEFAAHVLVFLTRAMQEAKRKGEPPIPPVDATFSLWDWCGTYFVEANKDTVGNSKLPPLLSWNSREGCNVIATPSYDWTYRHQNFTEGSSFRPDFYPSVSWGKRKNKIVWRGSLAAWDGSRARAVRVGVRYPDMMDVKVAMKNVSNEWATKHPPGEPEKSPVCFGFLVAIGSAGSVGGPAKGSECATIAGEYLNTEQQMHYKYALDMDGGASTFRLKALFLSGSVVFRVVHDAKEDQLDQFFFADLKPWVHYVPVSFEKLETDLPTKVKWAQDHDDKAKKIAEMGMKFAHEHLRMDDAYWQIMSTLQLMAKKQDGWTPDVRQEKHFRRFCCRELQEAHEELAVARLKLGRPPFAFWTNEDMKMYPALYEQCVDLNPQECEPNSNMTMPVNNRISNFTNASSMLGSAIGSAIGSTIKANAPIASSSKPSNFWATPVEWVALDDPSLNIVK